MVWIVYCIEHLGPLAREATGITWFHLFRHMCLRVRSIAIISVNASLVCPIYEEVKLVVAIGEIEGKRLVSNIFQKHLNVQTLSGIQLYIVHSHRQFKRLIQTFDGYGTASLPATRWVIETHDNCH